MAVTVLGNVCVDRVLEVREHGTDSSLRLNVTKESRELGGAGNVAGLVSSLGSEVSLLCCVPSDSEAWADATRLTAGIDLRPVGTLSGDVPERIRLPLGGRLVTVAIGAMGDLACSIKSIPSLDPSDAVIIADYGAKSSGWLNPSVAEEVIGAARPDVILEILHRSAPAPLTIDSGDSLHLVIGSAADLVPDFDIRINLPELAARLREIGRTGSGMVGIASAGSEGLFVSDARGYLVWVPIESVSEQVDATGAGDALAALLAVNLGRRKDSSEQSLSSIAAAADLSQDEVANLLSWPAGTSTSEPGLSTRSTQRSVVVAGGCFDPLHGAHVRLLEQASRLGGELVVALNSDSSVKRLKGDARPLMPQDERRAVLDALQFVDDVVIFEEDTPRTMLDRLKPDVFVKGGDYIDEMFEAEQLESWGGVGVVIRGRETRSSSSFLDLYSSRMAGQD